MVETVIIDSALERTRNPCRGSIEMDPFSRRRAVPPVCQAGGVSMLKYNLERLWGPLFKETSVLGTTRHALLSFLGGQDSCEDAGFATFLHEYEF